MFINNFFLWPSCPTSSTAKNIADNNQQEELGMIDLKTVNILMTTSEITKPASLPQTSTNLWEKQIHMSGLETSQIKISNTPGDNFQYQ